MNASHLIPPNCTDIDEFIDGYIKANGLDQPPLERQRDMIVTLLLSGMVSGIAILSNRIAETSVQKEANEQLQNVSDHIAKFSTETLIKLERNTTDGPIGTA